MDGDLLTTEGQLRAVCENATVALFVMDARQHCIYMNQAAEVLTGFTLGEVRGKPLHDFVHHTRPDGRPYPLEECPIDRAAPQDMQEHGEEVFVHKDGSFYPVAFTASPIRRDGHVHGTVIEVRDLRAERQREAERAELRELSQLMLREIELEAIVQPVTDASTRLTGAQFGGFFYNVEHQDGQGSYMLYALSGVPREAFERFPMPRATPLFGPTFRGEGTIRIDDVLQDPRYGKEPPHHGMPKGHLPVRSYLAVPVTWDNGEVLGGLFLGHAKPGVFSEAHARLVEAIAAQAAVGMSRARLFRAAQAGRERAEADAREKERLFLEAARANEMKDQFLAVISHELRTPLTSILGWSEMLATGRLAGEMVSQGLATIDRNARAQAQLIGDLLDISRISSGKLRLDMRAVDVAEPLLAATESVRSAAMAREVCLETVLAAGLGEAWVDPDRLQQVAWNLLSNAIKFSRRGGTVRLEARRTDAEVEVRVTDHGHGIDPAFLPRVFDRFSQMDASSTREHGGLGLGLSIVQQLVHMHGGTVEAHSDGLGHGATFTVRLPLARSGGGRDVEAILHAAAPAESRAVGSLGHELTGLQVLLVEDDRDSRDVLAAVLQAHGALVHACSSAAQALSSAPRVDMLISDIGMPQMDGYAFIRAWRARELAEGRVPVPALALTAYARDEDRERAIASGFHAHVAKPVSPAELVAAAARLHDGAGAT